jgi:hypothetical protein
MRLWYFLRSDTPLLDKMAIAWEDAAEQYVQNEWSKNEIIEVNIFFNKF